MRQLVLAIVVMSGALMRPESFGAQAAPPQSVAGLSALEGTFRDSLGHPVPFGRIGVEGSARIVSANDEGHFFLDSVPGGLTRFTASRLGFAPVTFQIDMPAGNTIHADIRLRSVVELQTIAVTADAVSSTMAKDGFYKRQRQGWGTFLTPEDLAKLPVAYPSLYLQGVRGVRLIPRRGGAPGNNIAFTDVGGGCVWLWVDGSYMGNTAAGGIQVDDLIANPQEIYAVEVYAHSNEVPSEFIGMSGRQAVMRGRGSTPPDHCGALVIWTKEHVTP